MNVVNYEKPKNITFVHSELDGLKVDYLIERGVQQKIDEAIKYYLESKSENTAIAFKQDMTDFLNWCGANSFCAIPVNPKVLRSYVIDLSLQYSPGTIERKLSTISNLHKILKLDSPAQEKEVSSAVIHIRDSSDYKKKQAVPARFNLIKMVEAELDYTKVSDIRDYAILHIAHSTLLRRSEVARINWEDIEIDNSRGDGTVTVHKIKSKKGENDTYVAYLSNDAVLWLRKWGKNFEKREGAVFVGLTKHGTLRSTRLTGHTIASIIKALGKRIDKDFNWSGHSTRVGAAQDMVANGINHVKAMNAGRWRDYKTFLGYVKKLEAKENGMAEMHRKNH